jgi:hypothetical protein
MFSMVSIRSPRVVLSALLVLLSAPAVASAHGDAASHYLETGSLYTTTSPMSDAVGLQLLGLLDASRDAGYPMKLALIADESDVPAMPAMLRHPQQYAKYVAGQIEGLGVRLDAPVVVVSPSGLGIAGPQPSDNALAGLTVPAGASNDALGAVAQATVRQLATASGHPLPADVAPAKVTLAPTSSSSSSSDSGYDLGGLLPIAVFAAIFGSALAFFEGRQRLARRRHRHITPTGEAA